jgi:hypothetical protein
MVGLAGLEPPRGFAAQILLITLVHFIAKAEPFLR